ncbi:hypothetical protein BN7_6581 [Wickerhamomyces ciferrii]|uniref:Uncharacterized protein n=1 Tax=Wickerhamomyces ciferrii (strain ATCC 14091 / BCRC 22168 / CBS 111 / JCM 3599 / NBRC 0793 / NRRL Y-1031 F-60-10) TaxID=1206466 RepID=K0L035_WICCF|nr:uncharacterized protein BN7_6581 [Wickerhamomyces ciferrii]CCH46974.1 hypothetical protein BN7_6581 [Wickerhamomyces ciferrii]
MNTKKSIKRNNRARSQTTVKRHDHWLFVSSNDIKSEGCSDDNQEDEDEEDSYTYLYSTKSDSDYSISQSRSENKKTVGSKIEVKDNVHVEDESHLISNQNQDSNENPTEDASTSPSPKSYQFINLSIENTKYNNSSPRPQSDLKFETAYIKRGKFKGFHDDRRYRCIYGNFDETSKCHREDCYCINASIYESPLRFLQSADSFSEAESIDFDDNILVRMTPEPSSTNSSIFHNKQSAGKASRKVSLPSLKLPSSSPGTPQNQSKRNPTQHSDRNSRVLYKVKQKFDHSHPSSAGPNTNNRYTPESSEKLSKRVKMYHSVNNLSKRSSLKQHWAGDVTPSMKDDHDVITRPQTARTNSKHRYLKSFRLHRDVSVVDLPQHNPRSYTHQTIAMI